MEMIEDACTIKDQYAGTEALYVIAVEVCSDDASIEGSLCHDSML